MIVWIESVRSTAYQTANTMARMAAKNGVLVVSGTLCASVMLSVISVPKTLMTTTTAQ